MSFLNTEQSLLCRDRVLSGETIGGIAADFGCCRSTISKSIKRLGVTEYSVNISSITLKPSKVFSCESIVEMINMHQNGASCYEIGRILNKHPNIIRQVLLRHGIKRTRSSAALIVCQSGARDNTLRSLIRSAKTDNRFNPKKGALGERNGSWKKDRSKIVKRRITDVEQRFFKSVIEKKCFRCELTGNTGIKLSVHHIKPVMTHPELEFDIGNCIVIDRRIHSLFHSLYTTRSCEVDWIEFVDKKYFMLYYIVPTCNSMKVSKKVRIEFSAISGVTIQRHRSQETSIQ